MELFLLFVVIIACVLIITLLYSIEKRMDHEHRFDRLEKGLLNNRHELVENKVINATMSKNYELLLKQLVKAQESISVSDDKLNALSKNIQNMNAIMVNTKKRGNFGEYQLYYLLSLYLGDSSTVYEKQYHLPNGKIADAIMHIPGQTQVMAIDSKFPQENYLRLVDDPDDEKAIADFRNNVRKHIRDIASKYLIPGVTTEEAIMFIPSEAIYLYICQEEPALIEEAHRAHVLITSPSTLMGVCMTLVNITKDYNRSRHMETLEKMIVALKDDSDRMVERYERARKTSETLDKQMNELEISINKLNKKIHQIYDGSMDE